MQLTPFEEQVMEAIRYNVAGHPGLMPFRPDFVVNSGRQIYGESWGGAYRRTSTLAGHYPLMLRFFGRLRIKGLLERGSDVTARSWGESWAFWQLTSLGCEQLGIDPASWIDA